MAEEEGKVSEEPDFAAEASEMGWVPKEEWKGNTDRWVDAKTFVERTSTVLPLVQQNNKEMQRRIAEQNRQIAALTAEIRASSASMKAIEESHAADIDARLKATKAEIGRQLLEAKNAGDNEREVQLIEQLTDLKVAEKVAKEGKPEGEAAPTKPTPPPLSQAYLEWASRNPWIDSDKRKSRRAMLIAEEIAEEHGGTLTGKAFYDKLDEELVKLSGNGASRRPSVDKTEGGRGRETGSDGKSFSDLPAEAKEACRKQSKSLVGPDRAFKDLKSWQERYAQTYFANE